VSKEEERMVWREELVKEVQGRLLVEEGRGRELLVVRGENGSRRAMGRG
jgi:hypothetical protein